MNKVVMKELIDKTTVVAEIEGYISNYKDIVAKIDRNDSSWVDSISMIDAKIGVLQHLLSFLNTLEVKETDDAYKQGYNDAIDKACKWLKFNFNMPDDFEAHLKKAMEEQQ